MIAGKTFILEGICDDERFTMVDGMSAERSVTWALLRANALARFEPLPVFVDKRDRVAIGTLKSAVARRVIRSNLSSGSVSRSPSAQTEASLFASSFVGQSYCLVCTSPRSAFTRSRTAAAEVVVLFLALSTRNTTGAARV
jgi:hypothetical protein